MTKRKKQVTLNGQIILIILVIIIGTISYFSNYESNEQTIRNVNSISFNITEIPQYSNSPYCTINNNKPSFTEEDYNLGVFENYSELDSLGRCRVAYANICKEIMPAKGEERQAIGMIKPSGWQTVKYEGVVEGNYLYNRCHLIGYQLAGENECRRNVTI